MKYIQLLTFIFTLFLLISISHGVSDTFQYHPYGDIIYVYEGESDSISWSYDSPYSYGGAIYSRLVPRFTDNVALFLVNARIKNIEPFSTDYISYQLYSPYAYGIEVSVYDEDDHLIGSYVYTGGWGLHEIVISAGVVSYRVDGVDIGSMGNGDEISYIKFDSRNVEFYIDDFSIGWVTGIGHDQHVNYENTHYLIDTDVYTPATAINATFTLKTIPNADFASSEYKYNVKRVSTGEILESDIVKVSGNSTLPAMVKNYNATTLFDGIYGTYLFYLTKNGMQVASDFVILYNPDYFGNSTIDAEDYLFIGMPNDITYYIYDFDPILYDFSIKIYDPDFYLIETISLTTDNGTETYTPESSATNGIYYVVLYAENKNDGTLYAIAHDMTEITGNVLVNGYTYNAELGAIIQSVNVSLFQSSSWHNKTSNLTGYYKISNLIPNVGISVNATKTNFTHEVFSVTPPISYSYEVDLYLFPTNRTLSDYSIVEGMTVDYPWQQGIGNVDVSIYNDTWSNSTTSNTFGYYVFNLSELVNGTYTVNATKSGYINSSEYTVTVLKNNSVVKNIVLTQNYVLTVKAIDSTSGAYISTFTATVEGTALSVTDGDATFSLDWGLYTVSVTATDYYAGSTNILLESNDTATVSLTRVESPYYDPDHFVKFTLQSIWGTRYENVETNVYVGDSTTALHTNSTGSDGAVVFELDEDVKYRFTFVNVSQGISETRTLYPVDTHYYVIVSSTFGSWDTYDIPISDGINFTISKEIINATHAYINYSYVDHLGATTSLDIYLNQTNTSDYFNQTNLDSFSGAGNNSGSFIVEDYAGESYLLHLVALHGTYGEIDSTYSISFKDDIATKFPGIPASVWLYSSIFILLFTGGIFVKSNVERGMLIVCIMNAIFIGLGSYNSLPSATQTSILAGTILGFIISIIANLNKSSKDEGYV